MIRVNTMDELINTTKTDTQALSGFYEYQAEEIIKKLKQFTPNDYYAITTAEQDRGNYKWVCIYATSKLSQASRVKIHYFTMGLEVRI